MHKPPSHVTIDVRGSAFTLLSERAVFWEDERILFCSDLHWGRESFLQSKGFAVPEVSFDKESALLLELAKKYEAWELWVLGDFIHHEGGVTETLRSGLRAWVGSLARPVRLIPGNHDRGIARWIGETGIRVEEHGIDRGAFRFRHEGEEEDSFDYYVWSGHLHPAIRIPRLLGHRKLPCFWVRKGSAYLPAFSRLAGGAEIDATNSRDRVYAIHQDEILTLGDE